MPTLPAIPPDLRPGLETAQGQVNVPLADLRAAPAAASELLNQALLGTPLVILGAQDDTMGAPWRHVRLPDYEGWMPAAAILHGAVLAAPAGQVCVAALSTDLHLLGPGAAPGAPLTVYMGTILPLAPESPGLRPSAGPVCVLLPDGCAAIADPAALLPWDPANQGAAPAVLESVRAFLTTPYLWGGMSRAGIDCSGLVQIAHRVHGYTLPRDADEQFHGLPQTVEPGAWQPGDLIFYGHSSERVIHVMIYAGGGRVVHAKGSHEVVDESLDPAAPDYHARPDQYLGARRVIPGATQKE